MTNLICKLIVWNIKKSKWEVSFVKRCWLGHSRSFSHELFYLSGSFGKGLFLSRGFRLSSMEAHNRNSLWSILTILIWNNSQAESQTLRLSELKSFQHKCLRTLLKTRFSTLHWICYTSFQQFRVTDEEVVAYSLPTHMAGGSYWGASFLSRVCPSSI